MNEQRVDAALSHHGRLYRIDLIPDGFRLTQSWWGRARDTMRVFVVAVVATAAFLSLFFLPDFALDYAHRGEDFTSFFVSLLVIVSLGVALATAALTLFRRRHVRFLPQAGTLCLCTHGLFGPRELTLPWSDFDQVELVHGRWLLTPTALLLTRHEAPALTLLEARFAGAELDAVADKLRAIIALARPA